MESDFHSATSSDSDHGAGCALPSESGLELLTRMPGLGFESDRCDGTGA